MKQILTVLICLIGINAAHAQWADNNAIYNTGEFSVGNYYGLDLNVNYVYKETYSFKLGYSGNLRKPSSQPEDYSSGLIGIILYGLANPYDQLEIYKIGIGKIYKLNEKGTIRANISLGVGLTTIREPVNWMRGNDAFFAENYTWDYHKYHTVSFIINPKIEFPFTRFYGLTLSPLVQVNKDRIFYGIGIGQMVGLLRKGKTKTDNVEE